MMITRSKGWRTDAQQGNAASMAALLAVTDEGI
jgi:hypothetical protein